MGEGINAFSSYLPVEINGWKKTEKDVIYTPKNLFKYITGGAELYISYGFKKVLTCKYKKENGPDITLDIFDMGTPSNAFGVFTHGFETTNEDMGQGSEYSDGLLTFWKGKYYVSILSFPETKELKKTILKLGRTIDGFIKKKGPWRK